MNTRSLFLTLLVAVTLPVLAFGAEGNFVSLTGIPVFEQAAGQQSLTALINFLYRVAIGIAAVIAVVQIVRAGVMYAGGASIGKVKEAKDLIRTSLLGLLLVLSPYIIFSIIDPRILSLKFDTSELQPGTSGDSQGTPGEDEGQSGEDGGDSSASENSASTLEEAQTLAEQAQTIADCHALDEENTNTAIYYQWSEDHCVASQETATNPITPPDPSTIFNGTVRLTTVHNSTEPGYVQWYYSALDETRQCRYIGGELFTQTNINESTQQTLARNLAACTAATIAPKIGPCKQTGEVLEIAVQNVCAINGQPQVARPI